MRIFGVMESHKEKGELSPHVKFVGSPGVGLHSMLTGWLEIPTWNLQQFPTSRPIDHSLFS